MISGPSGAGKSSICQRLLLMPDLDAQLSVSATTRPPRPGEVDGEHYQFLSREEFTSLEEAGGLLESATVFGDRYGTPRCQVEKGLAEGRTVLLDIDVQGARQLRDKEIDALYLFVTPPSLEVLEERLRGRRTEGPEALSRRLAGARRELDAQGEYDRSFLNDDVDRVAKEIEEAILSAGESGQMGISRER